MKKHLYHRILIAISIIVAVMAAMTLSGCDAKKEQDQTSLSISEYLEETKDEIWTSPLSQVIARYTKPDGSELCKEDFANKDVFIDIVTIPTRDTYYAMHVPKNTIVIVETAQGYVLHTNLPNAEHGEGDYLICTIGEDGGPNLSDVWVLNGSIFPDCYDTSHICGEY